MRNRKKILMNISLKATHNYYVRLLVKPFMIVKRKIEQYIYYKSEDSQYIRMYKNKYIGDTCFIVGNGPSLLESDLDKICRFRSFGCNRIYNIFDKTLWRPTFYMCGDRQVLIEEIQRIKEIKGVVKFVATWAQKYGRKENDELHFFLMSGKFEPHVERKVQQTVQEDVSRYFSVTQSIVCCEIEFAIYMGFKNIYLIGVDNNYPVSIDINGNKRINKNIKSHFNGGESQENQLNYVYYDAQIECYKNIEKYAVDHDINIYNATRGGKLEVFRRVSLEDVLRKQNS